MTDAPGHTLPTELPEAATRCALANGLLEVHMPERGDNASFAVADGTIDISGRT